MQTLEAGQAFPKTEVAKLGGGKTLGTAKAERDYPQ